MARIITIASGKGGVGKTNISINLALYLARKGYRTCFFDADLGLANINILLNLYPQYNLEDVIFNGKSLQDILIKDYHGIDIITGSSCVERMANLQADQVARLIKSFSALDEYDFFILDTSTGIYRSVISFCLASKDVILIVTPEPTSFADACDWLKMLSLNGFTDSVMVVVNQCKNVRMARVAFTKLKETVQKSLPINILLLGTINYDSHVVDAIKAQHPFISLYPNSNAAKCIQNIATHLVKREAVGIDACGLEAFWTNCLKLLGGPLQLGARRKDHRPSRIESRPPAKPQVASAKTVAAKSGPVDAPDAIPGADRVLFASVKDEEKAADDMPALINRLVDSILSVSHELAGIRKVLESDRRCRVDGDEREDGRGLIPLDFEAFLARRQGKD